MKLVHKRIPSGIQNCPTFQNTQRIQAPKKLIEIQQKKQTAKKQRSNDTQFFQLLDQLGLYNIYQIFLQFHCESQTILSEGDNQQLRQYCEQFKDRLWSVMQKQKQGQIQDRNQQESDKIKQLLQEIYNLRTKLSDLDKSMNVQSISSLDQNVKYTTINRASLDKSRSQSKSKSKNVLSNINYFKSEKLPSIDVVQQEVDKSAFNQVIANFMEMKVMIFQLLSINWRIVHLHLPAQAKYMFQNINSFYKNQLSNVIEYYSSNMASNALDTFSTLILISKECVEKIINQYHNKKQIQV